MRQYRGKCFEIIFIVIALIQAVSGNSQPLENKYAVALLYTPVLNTGDFESVFGGYDGSNVKLDNKGLIREMEFIAFPNTAFEILEVIPKGGYNVYRITTDEYPYNSSDLYIDSRFVQIVDMIQPGRIKPVLDKNDVLKNLNSLEGYGYMWGGNYADGIEQLLDFYKPKNELDNKAKDLWCLKGVDCSGLIYQATNGSTPRNTSSLVNYGEGVEIAGKNVRQISQMLKPLDLVVWGGHVVIVMDENTVIESTPEQGVHKSNLEMRLKSIVKERTPVNDWGSTSGKRFVIRRWIYDQE